MSLVRENFFLCAATKVSVCSDKKLSVIQGTTSRNVRRFYPYLPSPLKDCASDFLVAILFLSNFTPEIR